MVDEAKAAEVEASRLLREARDHKRASRRHRRAAIDRLAQLETLIASCRERGIQIQIHTKPEGGQGVKASQQHSSAA